ncbi:MAG TPA: PepSY1/2 domain-containing protein [Candidatus Deferrimicrobium sp.]|nr:PepSY1/2 domain-containing protein [Candidatus Deferrimicrobium sp.]
MRARNWLIGVLSIGLGVSLYWGYSQYTVAKQLGINQKNQYQQAARDMVSHSELMENFLAKAQASGSNANNLIHFTGAWQEANAALNNMSKLPVENPGSTHISQFLNQTSEFSYLLAQRIAGGGTIKPEEQKMLADLNENARKTNESLSELMQRVEYDNLAWVKPEPNIMQRVTGWFKGTAEADTTDVKQPTTVAQGIQMMDSQLQKLPPLEYEGRFTGKVTQEPKGLPPNEATKEQGQKNLTDFFGKLGLNYSIQYQEDTQGIIPTYKYVLNGNPNIIAETSKRGGVPMIFSDNREIGERTISPEDAKAKAANYLRNIGYPSLYLTSIEDYQSYVTLSYVVVEDGVRIYPDKVIVKVAMDNGEIVTYISRAYLMFHQPRNLGKPKLSVAQARRYLKPDFKVSDTALVLLAKDNYAEKLCYEFRGHTDSEEFLVYINVATGFEEEMYRILKTPEGEFLK